MKLNYQFGIINFLKKIQASFRDFINEGKKTYPFQLVAKQYSTKKNGTVFLIKVAGKNLVVKKTAQELVSDDAMLSGFSPLDTRTITYIACQENLPALTSIIKQEYSTTASDLVLHIKHLEKNTTETKTAKEISQDQQLLKQFNQKDAHRIGYLFGMKSEG